MPGDLKAVWPEIVGSVFGVWEAPGGIKTIQKGGGLRLPSFWMVLKPPAAAQTLKTDTKVPGQIAFKYTECQTANTPQPRHKIACEPPIRQVLQH